MPRRRKGGKGRASGAVAPADDEDFDAALAAALDESPSHTPNDRVALVVPDDADPEDVPTRGFLAGAPRSPWAVARAFADRDGVPARGCHNGFYEDDSHVWAVALWRNKTHPWVLYWAASSCKKRGTEARKEERRLAAVGLRMVEAPDRVLAASPSRGKVPGTIRVVLEDLIWD